MRCKRPFFHGALFITIAGALTGCHSSISVKPATSPVTQADKVTSTKVWVMQSDKTQVLKLTTSADTKCISANGSLHFNGPLIFDEVEVWLLPGIETVDDAIGRVGPQIASEFKDFKPDHTTDIMIAGSLARQFVGPGHEADDGDAGAAEVIVFKVGDHIFVACTHGETLEPLAQQWMFTLVQTAQAP